MYSVLLSAGFVLLLASPAHSASDKDPFVWLEEVEGKKVLSWVKEHNAKTTAELEATPEFKSIYAKNFEIFNSEERIPEVSFHLDRLFNFWRDAEHVRGLWRWTTLREYRKIEPTWTVVLDLDALAATEKESWVWKGATCLPPEDRLCMVALSRGGGDATVLRELDTYTGRFVGDGFTLAEAKSTVSWKDADTLWVATDFGKGTLTTAGYPRIVKEWRRGTPLESASTLFEGKATDVTVRPITIHTLNERYDIIIQRPEFFTAVHHLMHHGKRRALDLPRDAVLRTIFKDHLIFSLRSDWTVSGTTYPRDALLAIKLDAFLSGDRAFEKLFEPSERVSLDEVSATQNYLLVSTLDNVRGRLHRFTLAPGRFTSQEVALPGLGTVRLSAASRFHDIWMSTYTDLLTPTRLQVAEGDRAPEQVKSDPEYFDATGMQAAQYHATSKDGTQIPYFVVTPRTFKQNGSQPTLLYGYGGFEIPILPTYLNRQGAAWLERGGVYVRANIRGGGEFGPRWHQAALKKNRQRAFDDFIAVAEDLIRRKITSPEHLGIIGGSNGGLLVGATLTQRPELFGAVVCAVPLLDMRRFHKLLAGASWMAEYGNPDKPEDWAYIRTWSPYHNLRPDKEYPKVYFFTSTRDDRVHPGHARKMVAKMESMGHPVYYYENTEGGHAAAADNNQQAYMWALAYSYLWKLIR